MNLKNIKSQLIYKFTKLSNINSNTITVDLLWPNILFIICGPFLRLLSKRPFPSNTLLLVLSSEYTITLMQFSLFL